jgi:hypothetical protein
VVLLRVARLLSHTSGDPQRGLSAERYHPTSAVGNG